MWAPVYRSVCQISIANNSKRMCNLTVKLLLCAIIVNSQPVQGVQNSVMGSPKELCSVKWEKVANTVYLPQIQDWCPTDLYTIDHGDATDVNCNYRRESLRKHEIRSKMISIISDLFCIWGLHFFTSSVTFIYSQLIIFQYYIMRDCIWSLHFFTFSSLTFTSSQLITFQ